MSSPNPIDMETDAEAMEIVEEETAMETTDATFPAAVNRRGLEGRRLGEAKNTDGGYEAGLKLFDWWQMNIKGNVPFRDMTEEQVEGHHLQRLLQVYARWLTETKVPKKAE